jgi:hypothetical protein
MARKPRRLNTEASICRTVAKYGLDAHLFYNADGTIAAVKVSKPGLAAAEDVTKETSEDLRKLL